MGIDKGPLGLCKLCDQRIDRLLVIVSANDFADFRLLVQFSCGSASLRAYT